MLLWVDRADRRANVSVLTEREKRGGKKASIFFRPTCCVNNSPMVAALAHRTRRGLTAIHTHISDHKASSGLTLMLKRSVLDKISVVVFFLLYVT